MNLTAQIDRWEAYWKRANDPAEVERQLARLRWLEEFAIASGEAIGQDQWRALKQEIAHGEQRLAELDGIPGMASEQPEQPDWVNR
jgi:hypothetical protein